MVDGVDEADPDMSVVVRHQHDVKQLFALRIQLAQTGIYRFQSLLTTR